jgi:hypothetical protein
MVPGYLVICFQHRRSNLAHPSILDSGLFTPHWSTDYQLASIGLKGDPTISYTSPQTIVLLSPSSEALCSAVLSVYPHPFYPNVYTAWVVLTSTLSEHTTDLPEFISTIERYAFDLQGPYRISISQRSSSMLDDGHIGDWADDGISFSVGISQSVRCC